MINLEYILREALATSSHPNIRHTRTHTQNWLAGIRAAP